MRGAAEQATKNLNGRRLLLVDELGEEPLLVGSQTHVHARGVALGGGKRRASALRRLGCKSCHLGSVYHGCQETIYRQGYVMVKRNPLMQKGLTTVQVCS